jgi:hypothetical protein
MKRKITSRFLAVLAASGLLVACGGNGPQQRQKPETGETSQHLDPCSDDNITWRADLPESQRICAGPFDYDLKCWRLAADGPNCGWDHHQQTCQRPRTCTNPDWCGVSPTQTEDVHYSPVIYGTPASGNCPGWGIPGECEPCEDHPGSCEHPTCWYPCIRYFYSTSCHNEAVNIINSYPAGYPRDRITIIGDGPPVDQISGVTTCDITIRRPVALSCQDPRCGMEDYDCSYDTPRTCRHQSHGEDTPWPGGCNPADLHHTTAPGLSRQAFHTAVPPDTIHAESCETGEDLPAPGPKFTRLKNLLDGLGGPVPAYQQQPALATAAISYLKLLMELHGADLGAADRTYIENLYNSPPIPRTLGTNCGATFNAPDVPPTCTTTPAINGTMEVCTRMTVDHSTAASLQTILGDCLNALTPITALPSECHITDYEQSYVQLSEGLLEKEMTFAVAAPGSTAQLTEIRNKLAFINQWYTGLRHALYPANPLDDDFQKQISRVVKELWKPLYLNHAISLQVTTPQEAEIARTTVLNDGLTADFQVLKASYGAAGAPPMDTLPLLIVTGDALRGIDERVLSLSTFSDMGCRFKPCVGVVTPTSAFLNLLGWIQSKTDLNNSLTPQVQAAIGTDWTTVFTKIGSDAGHAAFESAFRDAQGMSPSDPYQGSIFISSSIDDLSDPVRQLVGMIREAHSKSRAYAATGLFVPKEAKELDVGLDLARQDAILAELNRVIGILQSSETSYQSAKVNLVRGLLDQIQNQSLTGSLDQRSTALLQKIADLTSDLGGLEGTASVDQARYSQFMKSFEAIAETITEQGQQIERRLNINDIFVSAQNTRYPLGGLPDRIENVGVTPDGDPSHLWVIPDQQPGTILNFEITGRWAPSCALTQMTMLDGSSVRVTLPSSSTPIYTGPEGYSLTRQADGFAAESNQTITSSGIFRNVTHDRKACAGGGLGISFVVSIGLGSGEACTTWSNGNTWSHTTSDSDTDGSERRSTFSYATGIRSDITPFSQEPVGGLLLIQLPHGDHDLSHVQRVRVLMNRTSVLVDSNSDYYLVVNDNIGGCLSQDPEQLSIQVNQLLPAGVASRAMAEAMAAAVATLQNDAGPIVAQGRVLPEQLAAARRDAYAELYARCGCTDLNGYAESLKNLFETYIEKELVQIQRQVEMVNIERQIRDTMSEIRVLQNELDHARAAGHLLELIPAWALRDLDGLSLRSQLNLLGQTLAGWVYPVVVLRYPEVITSFTPDERALIDRLSGISITAALDDMANVAIQAAQAVEGRLRHVRIAHQHPVNTVVFSIPKPGVTSRTSFRKVDNETATRFWSDALSGLDPTLAVKPEYFYANLQPDYLPCDYSAPVINSMVFYLFHDGGNPYHRSQVSMDVDSLLKFPLTAGIENYEFTDHTYLGPFVTVLEGSVPYLVEDAFTAYWNEVGSQVATGLSPFSDWHFDLGPYRAEYPLSDPRNALNIAEEILVAFRVEARPEEPGSRLPGVATCQ